MCMMYSNAMAAFLRMSIILIKEFSGTSLAVGSDAVAMLRLNVNRASLLWLFGDFWHEGKESMDVVYMPAGTG